MKDLTVYKDLDITNEDPNEIKTVKGVIDKIAKTFLGHFTIAFYSRSENKVIFSGSSEATVFDFFPAPIHFLDINRTIRHGNNITLVRLETSIDNIRSEFCIEYDSSKGMAVSLGEIPG